MTSCRTIGLLPMIWNALTFIWRYRSNTLRTKTHHGSLTLCKKTFHRPYTSVIKYSLRKNGLVKCSVWDLIGQFGAPGQVIWVMPYESILDEGFSWHYFNGSAAGLIQPRIRKYFRKVLSNSTEIATESRVLYSTEIFSSATLSSNKLTILKCVPWPTEVEVYLRKWWYTVTEWDRHSLYYQSLAGPDTVWALIQNKDHLSRNRNSHYKDKTVVYGNSYTDALWWEPLCW